MVSRVTTEAPTDRAARTTRRRTHAVIGVSLAARSTHTVDWLLSLRGYPLSPTALREARQGRVVQRPASPIPGNVKAGTYEDSPVSTQPAPASICWQHPSAIRQRHGAVLPHKLIICPGVSLETAQRTACYGLATQPLADQTGAETALRHAASTTIRGTHAARCRTLTSGCTWRAPLASSILVGDPTNVARSRSSAFHEREVERGGGLRR